MPSVKDFRKYAPDDAGSWSIFVEGISCPKLVKRAFGRYDAVVRWTVRNIPMVSEIVLESIPVVVPDNYGKRKRAL